MTFPSISFREFHSRNPERAQLRQQQIYDPIIELVSRLKPYHLLDIGCGTGELTVQLSQYCGKVTAIDPSRDAIDIAKGLANDHVEFIVGDVTKLPQEARFDCVVCCMVLNCVEMLDTFTENLSKHLTSSSHQIWTILHPSFSFNDTVSLLLQEDGSLIYTAKFDATASYFTENRYYKDLDDCKLVEYHRPLSKIISTLLNAGFVLHGLEEPVPKTQTAQCQKLAALIPKVVVLKTGFVGSHANCAEWIGVDLDGTLAIFDGWHGPDHIGAPIWPMVSRVKQWLDDGKLIKIFSSRANNPICIRAIQSWCMEYLGVVLDITNIKDEFMVELWDDRAIRVETNSGLTRD